MFYPKIAVFFLLASSLTFVGCNLQRQATQLDGGVFLSLDYGETWNTRSFVRFETKTRRLISINDVTIHRLIFDPVNPSMVYALTKEDGLYVTENDGKEWRKTGLSAGNITALSVDPQDTQRLFAARGKEILRSIDQGTTWEIVFTDTHNALLTDVDIDFYDLQNVYATTDSGTVLKSLDGGVNWEILYVPGKEIRELILDSNDSRIVYLVIKSRGFQKSIDSGVTWQDFREKLAEFSGATTIQRLIVDPQNSQHILIASTFGLLESFDAGASWKPIQTLLTAPLAFSAFALDPQDSQRMYFAIKNLMHKTEDGGLTWKTIENFPSKRPVIFLIAHPIETNALYAGTLKVEKKRRGIFPQPAK
ncbi:MAG: hypothetical protein A3B74_03870 [Candidatus Kerfeldbacteria bacterium RIFCSPHIGHO2_02_FULL_42_14]|uniref:Photosynthesis system II assembly factor Ycf48/Hcf136-like domain-containing protein n=1 Tax=Candidatus Kerfeldbacteria bacterium RIFCSPHIGHO2_02_FULL_42_14 TaxID=1798540 RepID=A0A1G2ASM6_9BACT|nr:MAG: hypothetical protein A3B74_03870 [Candidatus Kerfeldbacteria bacterium RIFCSPHIGHO2_02_FULL_42_14]OGY80651.1 MAG: hypothetical protein A3E60_04370 [Candidatus Kerfeldbacteria bacterium RIFCSPHIGHO2_12_FULL_42_13]OGY82575.1 MAG: hypothetical protein A3I91_04030 [Candidatus Kerfeldbacteria bacterium RIFCSPLOWO2_02_FULL_42_19]OGY85179.1 MAG: hypothetical protein A3G01_01160 [Candidatus Kerfeldbacteria bacterium RIFCSPLOWO2_12_FULL_43_9]